jgi:drug/metabolite transporter (DMT)-like permease
VTRSYVFLVGSLAALWGASYLFIKVAGDDIEPATMMFFRTLLAVLLLLPFLLLRSGARRGVSELGAAWRPGLVLGVVNAALPFTLIAWGERHVDSGVAAIANATVPLFVVLLAIPFVPSERASGTRLLGLLLGLAGVAVLAGGQPGGGWWAVAGTLAVVVASLCYATAGLYGQLRVSVTAGPVLATASMIGATLVLLPFALLGLPDQVPGWKAIGSVIALGVLGTALAQLVLFRSLRLHGSSRTSLVTYLLPVMALFYGFVLLGEPLTAATLGGLALILPGVALGQRRSAVAPASAAAVSDAAPVPSTIQPGRPDPSTPARPSSAPAMAASARPNTVRPPRRP